MAYWLACSGPYSTPANGWCSLCVQRALYFCSSTSYVTNHARRPKRHRREQRHSQIWTGSAAAADVDYHFTRPPFDSITPETRSSKLLQRPSTSRVALMSSTTPFKRFSYWARVSNQHWLGVVVVTEHSLSNSTPLQLESELQEASHRTLTFEFDSNATRI